jgi:hypothetical protein
VLPQLVDEQGYIIEPEDDVSMTTMMAMDADIEMPAPEAVSKPTVDVAVSAVVYVPNMPAGRKETNYPLRLHHSSCGGEKRRGKCSLHSIG